MLVLLAPVLAPRARAGRGMGERAAEGPGSRREGVWPRGGRRQPPAAPHWSTPSLLQSREEPDNRRDQRGKPEAPHPPPARQDARGGRLHVACICHTQKIRKTALTGKVSGDQRPRPLKMQGAPTFCVRQVHGAPVSPPGRQGPTHLIDVTGHRGNELGLVDVAVRPPQFNELPLGRGPQPGAVSALWGREVAGEVEAPGQPHCLRVSCDEAPAARGASAALGPGLGERGHRTPWGPPWLRLI